MPPNENQDAANVDDNANQDADIQANEKPSKKDTVAYDTYQKAITEKKQLAAKLKEFEDNRKKQEETELKQKEDYKKMLELRDMELNETKTKLVTVESRLAAGTKMSAFLENLNGKVEKQYWGLIDLDSIVLDSETGLPDEMSVKKAVKDFQTTYPEIIKTGDRAKMPNDAAKNTGVSITLAEWSALSYDEKRKRMKDVKQSS